MLSVQDAETHILNLVHPLSPNLDREWVALEQSAGRILADAVLGKQDVPAWDNSAMDGYAVRTADLQTCSAETPVSLQVVMEIPAGQPPRGEICTGQAARIFTGAMLPPGSDAVVMQENTRREGDRILILECPQPGAWVRAQGDYYKARTPLLTCGTRIQAPEIAILATVQCTSVPVYRRPTVSVMSTGNELIRPEQTLQPGQIVDSNQPLIAALAAQTGALVHRLGIIPDQRSALQEVIATAVSQSDVVISTGGVSVGDYDYVDAVIAELGGTIHIQSVAIKPGKPLTFATFDVPNAQGDRRTVLFFGLPGNPVSVPVCFWRFVHPALRKLSGLPAPWGPVFVKATARQALERSGQRETYLWGKLHLTPQGTYEFELAKGIHSSANLINLAHCTGLAVLGSNNPSVAVGDPVRVLKIE